MLVPVAWLKSFLPKLPPTPKLVEVLMMHGLDVEEVIDLSEQYHQVIVGEVLTVRPHPRADKLRLVEVVINPHGQTLEIVCGASNIATGQKVAVALVGAKLPNGLTIAKREIRGIESNGMVCAADELGLGQDHSGILVLASDLKVGTPFAKAISLDEVVIDVAVPANRADLMAIRGLAWEIGAMLGLQPKVPPPLHLSSKRRGQRTVNQDSVKPGKPGSDQNSLVLKITNLNLCSRLTARMIRGVTIKPTPPWIVSRLRAAGMRSVNIIVDITNYVMLEYGQPLHAYDAAQVHGPELIARLAKPGEQLITLDGKTRTLTPSMLVIADADRVVGIAGVMGGADTEVSEDTTDIILEAAIFDPVSIRKTSRSLGLVSEASKRFEKGLWPSLPAQASAAAAALMAELCGGIVEPGSIQFGMAPRKQTSITLNPGYIAERLGTKVPMAKSKTLLTKLGFGVKGIAKTWKVTVPEWRLDVSLPEDIVDEVGRMVGYNTVPQQLPPTTPVTKELPIATRFIEEVKNILVDMKFTEVISHAFYGATQAAGDAGRHFEIANPLDKTQHVLRKSLTPQIQAVLQREAEAGHDAMIFEIGRVFDPNLPGEIDQKQPWKISLGVAHKGPARVLETVTKTMKEILKVELHSEIVRSDKFIRGRQLEYLEFDINALMTKSKITFGLWDPSRHISRHINYREPSKYPAIVRDIAFWWPKDEQSIRDAITALGIDVLREFTVKDRFVKDGKTSFALSFIYQSPQRTLTKAEVDKLEQKIKDALVIQGATIR